MRSSESLFLKTSLGASLMLVAGCGAQRDPGAEATGTTTQASVRTPQTPLDGNTIPKFVDQLPTFTGRRISGAGSLNVNMQEFQQKILPASVYAGLPAPFNAGTYSLGLQPEQRRPDLAGAHHRSACTAPPTTAIYTNSLTQHAPAEPAHRRSVAALGRSARHHGAQQLRQRAAAGGGVHPALRRADPGGRPPARRRGPVAVRRHTPTRGSRRACCCAGAGFVTNMYNYVNTQDATTLWFHDHALGVVRENVYAGLAGMYFIRDSARHRSRQQPDHPALGRAGGRALAGRQASSTPTASSTSPTPTQAGSLNGGPGNPDKHPFWIPEFFGDVITVNGKAWPVMDVQPRRYRFRVVNGSNARFYSCSSSTRRASTCTRTAPSVRRSGRSARTAASSTTRSC